MLDLQEYIGKRQFFEGWLHIGWERLQDGYYTNINSKRNGKRWMIAVITKLWEIAWDIWDFCNEIFHHQTNESSTQDSAALDFRLRNLSYTLTITGLCPKDSHLAEITLDRLLMLPRFQKVEWLNQAELALTLAKNRHFQLLRS
jgi:hypothetical protein